MAPCRARVTTVKRAELSKFVLGCKACVECSLKRIHLATSRFKQTPKKGWIQGPFRPLRYTLAVPSSYKMAGNVGLNHTCLTHFLAH